MDLIIRLFSDLTIQKTLLFLLLSAGPTIIWLLICLRLDRSAPEPGLQILKIFIFGCLITFPLIPLTGRLTDLIEKIPWISSLMMIFVLSFFIDGLIEEFFKYLILKLGIYQLSHFDELRDGFIYGMILGLGFAFVENILYGLFVGSLLSGAGTVLLRGFTSTFMHFLTGGIIGYYLGLAKFNKSKNKLIVFQGLFLAVVFHGLYNTIVRFNWWWNLIPLTIILVFSYILILKKIKKISLPRI
ncbi:MAG: PrsW family glutamic-type intramembrane protease [Patescibacteria group bacterium]|jgi:RsiW-degrading membrane proteinase PrsW (M82 family)|nr:PrsW family glutamic-type intramembrane protease [Patescibacteria group bacterium]MDD5172883.1 PrsW family glutamic-type intramembrane protease [Patescibacteria group bacterium]